MVRVMRTLLLIGAMLCAVVAGLWALGTAVQADPTYQGDHLGMVAGESAAQYDERAAASLDQAKGTSWALVTFTGALDPAAADAALEPAPRVSAVVYEGVAARDIPEPVAGENRADVFTREAGRLQAETGLAAAEPVGAVVRGTPDQLGDISRSEVVFSVEVLPPDARWGAFAIAPVAPR